jgi:hypothetical protein
MLFCFGKSEIINTHFFFIFSSLNFLKKCNGIRFARNDDRSEVAMCMEWIITKNIHIKLLFFFIFDYQH